MMELVQQLTQNLGIEEHQAEGGLGLLLGVLRDKLPGGDFAALSEALPEAESLIDRAPSSESPAGGLLGGVMSAIGGGGLQNLAQLANGFSGLGMDSGLVAKFIPLVASFLGDKGGPELAQKVTAVLRGE